jgi:acid phosphatase (class A)
MENNTVGYKVTIAVLVVLTLALGGSLAYFMLVNKQDTAEPVQDNAEAQAVTDANNIPTDADGRFIGYVSEENVIDGRTTLAKMPTLDSATKTLDDVIAKNMVDSYYDTDRWLVASADAELKSDSGTQCHFNCQLGVTVSKEGTPHLYALISRISADAHHGAAYVKEEKYRQRPFAQAAEEDGAGSKYSATCRPDEETTLNENSSYPSGHTTFGYLAGLVLAQVDPEDASKLIARGRQYSESRLVCNYHWYSDIQAGRELASAVYDTLQESSSYLADLKAAQEEFKAVQAKGEAPTKEYKLVADKKATSEEVERLQAINDRLLNKDCDWENDTLATDLTSALAR